MNEVEQFFQETLPKAVVDRADRFLSAEGVVSITVAARGQWTIRFGSFDAPVTEGGDPEADLRVWFGPTAFAEFVAGTLDAAEAVKKRRVRLSGDRKLLERLGFLLEFGGSASPLSTLMTARGG
jgi:putative sterol carrier protein